LSEIQASISIVVIETTQDLMASISLKKPYLLMIGDIANKAHAKTALGLRDWAGDDCLGQLRMSADAVDTGLPDMTIDEAVAAGARTLVIGIAPLGGQLPEHWHPVLANAIRAGLDLAAGLHQRLSDISMLSGLATAHGRSIHDVRHSTASFPVGTGLKRAGRRLLTVGTDCALGKKYTALTIARAMQAKGLAATFRATGQTGILIAGEGVAVDAVVADFISGTAEALSPANDPDHWDVIEGQGSLFHPSYAGVTLGLLHGSQPDALVLCHDPSRTTMLALPHVPSPQIDGAFEPYLMAARVTNEAARFVGVSLNTSALGNDEAVELIERVSHKTGLPCVDPLRTGVEPIVAELASWS